MESGEIILSSLKLLQAIERRLECIENGIGFVIFILAAIFLAVVFA